MPRPRAHAPALLATAALLAAPVPALAAAPGAWGADAVASAQTAGLLTATPGPSDPITLDTFLRWAVRAEGLALRPYNPAPDMAGLAGTPGLADGSYGAAASAGLVDFADYQTGVFPALDPIPRQAAVVIAVRMLGLPPGTAPLPFADAAAIPDWARGFWATAVQQGILRGYPDRTLRPDAPMTAAEAATVLLRLQALWRAEEIPGVSVAAPGGTPHSALAARIGGRLYVAGAALYGQVGDTFTGETGTPKGGPELSVGPGNRFWRLQGTLTCTAGAAECTYWDGTGRQSPMPLPSPPIDVSGHVLLPVDGGALPWLQAVSTGAAVTVTPAADWPGTRLPATRDGATLVPTAIPPVEPGVTYTVGTTFRDAAGEGIAPQQPLTATFTAPADSPLLLGDGAGTPGPVTVSAGIPTVPLHIPPTRNLPEGPYTVTEDLAGYAPVTWQVRVHDPRPYTVALQAPRTAAPGSPVTVAVTLLDRYGAPADVDYAPAKWGVSAQGPAGTVPIAADLTYGEGTVIYLFQQGVAHYSFTPHRPGTYTITAGGAGADGWALGPVQIAVTVS